MVIDMSKYIRYLFYLGIPLVLIIAFLLSRVDGRKIKLPLTDVEQMTIAFGNSGETAEIDADDVVKILDSINNFTYYKIDRTKYAGWSYVLTLLDSQGNVVSKVGIEGEYGLSFEKGRYFSHEPHGLIEIVEKYRSDSFHDSLKITEEEFLEAFSEWLSVEAEEYRINEVSKEDYRLYMRGYSGL